LPNGNTTIKNQKIVIKPKIYMNTGHKSKKLAHGSGHRVYGFFVNCYARVLKSLYNI